MSKLRELIGKAAGYKVTYSTIVNVPGDSYVVDLHLYPVRNAEAIATLIEAAEKMLTHHGSAARAVEQTGLRAAFAAIEK